MVSVCQNTSQIDIWFLLNGVSTFTGDEFQQSLNFINYLSNFFWISTEKVQIGFSSSFQDNHHIFFPFKRCTTRESLQVALDLAVNPTSE